MIWQDVVIMVAVFGFSLALIPSIRGKDKPSRKTCIITICLLILVAVSFATLHFWLSLAANLTNTVAWSVLLFQKRS